MLILVSKGKPHGGFFLKRQARKGKLPPAITGMHLGQYPCILLEVYGKLHKQAPFLAPYIRRGDVLIPNREVASLWDTAPYIRQYKQRLCVNQCISRLQQQKNPSVAIVDYSGDCAGVVAELLSVCNTVWVVTNRPELFEPCAAYTMEQYGTTPLFASQIPKVDLVLAPEGLMGLAPPAGTPAAVPDGAFFPLDHQVYIPPYIDHFPLPGFDPVALTAGVFCAFYPGELMEQIGKI